MECWIVCLEFTNGRTKDRHFATKEKAERFAATIDKNRLSFFWLGPCTCKQ